MPFEGSPPSLGYPSLSHPLPLDTFCLGFSSDQTTMVVTKPSNPKEAVRAHHSHGHGLQASIRDVAQHLSLLWIGGKVVMEGYHFWGSLRGQNRQNQPAVAGFTTGLSWGGYEAPLMLGPDGKGATTSLFQNTFNCRSPSHTPAQVIASIYPMHGRAISFKVKTSLCPALQASRLHC